MRVANGFGELYCTRGEHWVDPDRFPLDKRAKTGRASWCRECMAEYRRQRAAQAKSEQLRALAKQKQLQPIF
ncbi:hypothetical protein [Microbulbifer agarilyticus]